MRNENCDRKSSCDDYKHGHCDGCGGNKPKGDLISREALKKELHNFFDGKIIDEPSYILRDVFCYIDNAPTVKGEILTKLKSDSAVDIDGFGVNGY